MTRKIDFIILNAGMFGRDWGSNQTRRVTEDGFEEHFQVMLETNARIDCFCAGTNLNCVLSGKTMATSLVHELD